MFDFASPAHYQKFTCFRSIPVVTFVSSMFSTGACFGRYSNHVLANFRNSNTLTREGERKTSAQSLCPLLQLHLNFAIDN